MATAKIITIGDELLLGQVSDTNSSFIARRLSEAGIVVREFQSIEDTPSAICDAVSSAVLKYDVVVTTGGLGPTKDDLTKAALGRLFGNGDYKTSKEQMAVNEAYFKERGIEMTSENVAQAQVPVCAEVIVNHKGTAPIMVFDCGDGGIAGTAKHRLYCMPGVPFEMRAALPDVLEDIHRHFSVHGVMHRCVMTYGIAESTLSRLIEPWETALPKGMHLAYLPDPVLGVRLRLDYDSDAVSAGKEVAKLCKLIPQYVYALEDTSLQEVVVKMLSVGGVQCFEGGQTLAVAESVTGGNISHLLTLVSGCSSILKGTVTAYTNEAKTNILGVSSDVIEKHTEVSCECAKQMALGVKRLFGADYGLATTGFSEPWAGAANGATGSTVAESSNPLAWVAVALPSGEVRTTLLHSNSTRPVNIDRFSAGALFFLLKNLQ